MVIIDGEQELIDAFEAKFELIQQHFNTYNVLSLNNIDNLMLENGASLISNGQDDEILVHGTSGNKIKARTVNQKKMVQAVLDHDMVFAVGPAGTGKTYTAVALAVRALKAKEVKRIVLTRPAVEAGENLGFLPGDLKDKLDPYLMPLYDALRDMAVAEMAANPDQAFTIIGDYNIAPTDADVWDISAFANSTHVTEPERAKLLDLEAIGLIEVIPRALKGEPYTFWDYRDLGFQKGKGMRIDLIYGNARLTDCATGAYVDREARKGKGSSDHAPVIMEINS